MISVPERLRHSVAGDEGGEAWLAELPTLVDRAVQRWQLTLGQPFEGGMVAWTASATDPAGAPVVLKISYPHSEARYEAAALRAWDGNGAVRLLDAHEDDWALLLVRCLPGTALRDEGLDERSHVEVGAGLLQRMGAIAVPPDAPMPRLAEVAAALADTAEERIARFRLDDGLLRHGVDLLRTLPSGAPREGLVHGDLNPGNILRDGPGWTAIDPKALIGDLAWDPWPLLTQIGDWTTAATPARVLAERTRWLADRTGLDAARIAAWATARGVESALWAANRGWWTGYRGADGDLARSREWAAAAELLGG